MSADEEAARRRTDPLMQGVSDGVAASYDAAEYLLEGVRESIRMRGAGRGSMAASRSRPQPRRERPGGNRGRESRRRVPPARDLVDEIAGLVTEMIELGADLAGDVAGAFDGRDWNPEEGSGEKVALAAAPDAVASVGFRVTNTGATALRGVALDSTDLIGGGGRIGPESVSFDPPGIGRIRPGGSESVEISLQVPADALPGVYRGVVAASPGEAWAVLEFTVGAAGVKPAESATTA